MLDAITIEGGTPLNGTIEISPAKNAVLPLMTAAMLAQGESRLERVPALADVKTLGRLMRHMGVQVEPDGEGLSLSTSTMNGWEAPYDLVKTMRASVLVLGPLVGRFGRARVSLPGGCAIGARPIDQHLMGLERLGAKVELEHGYVSVHADRLRGAHIVFDMATVTGTENLLMAACLAEGTTVLENAAREPEVEDLALCLQQMGAKIEGVGTGIITIEGVDELKPFTYTPVADRIEAGTYMVAAAMVGGDLRLKGARLDHLDAVIEKLRQTGAGVVEADNGDVLVRGNGRATGTDIRTSTYPGFPTDMQAQFMALLATAEGNSVVTERIFENRYMHAAELNRMGADIQLEGASAVVRGVRGLSGAHVMATDLRASAALVIAGLAAQGETVISRVYHLDRGYERMEEKLRAVGARIRRIEQ